MNEIKVAPCPTPYDKEQFLWVIDGKPLTLYLEELVKQGRCKALSVFESMLGLYPAGGKGMLFAYEHAFVWNLLESEASLNIPILLCEDDLDFSCIIIVVKVHKETDFVRWEGIGLLQNWDEKEAGKHGILCTDAYTDADWEKYGGTLAWAALGSRAWKEWISANWEEEQKKRYQNYVKPYMQRDENIIWIGDLNFTFFRQEYEHCVREAKTLF